MGEEEKEVLARYVSSVAGNIHAQRRKFQDEIFFMEDRRYPTRNRVRVRVAGEG